MAYIRHCECNLCKHCNDEPMFLVRVTKRFLFWKIEKIRAVCGNCHFGNTPILTRIGC